MAFCEHSEGSNKVSSSIHSYPTDIIHFIFFSSLGFILRQVKCNHTLSKIANHSKHYLGFLIEVSNFVEVFPK